MFNPKNNGTEFNFWPSIADTLLAIFMVFLMLWLAEKLIFLQQLDHVKTSNEILNQKFAELNAEHVKSDEDLKKSDEDLKKAEETTDEATQKTQKAIQYWKRCEREKRACEFDLKNCQQQQAQTQSDLESCQQQQSQAQSDLENCQQQQSQTQLEASQTEQQLRKSLQQCKSDNPRYSRDKPPIINLPETLGFSFNTGQALLSEKFENRLKNDIVPKLKDIKNNHNVNVIEVIGHTDGVLANKKGRSNLDQKLETAVANGNISSLRYGSNADLGLIRALAVAFFLRKQPELSGVKFRVYSAAQLILPDGELANQSNRYPNEDRRRIELRFTNLGAQSK